MSKLLKVAKYLQNTHLKTAQVQESQQVIDAKETVRHELATCTASINEAVSIYGNVLPPETIQNLNNVISILTDEQVRLSQYKR